MQLYADIYLLLNYSSGFRRPSHPSSGVYETVVALSAADHIIGEASFSSVNIKSIFGHVLEFWLSIYILIYCTAMENIKYICTCFCFCLKRFCKKINITLEPNHFAFPEKPRTSKTILHSLEFSAHQEVCTR